MSFLKTIEMNLSKDDLLILLGLVLKSSPETAIYNLHIDRNEVQGTITIAYTNLPAGGEPAAKMVA